MNSENDALERLIAGDAARLRETAPTASPLQAWHAARADAAWRLARRLRWIGLGMLALAAIAALSAFLFARFAIWWLLPLAAVLWPLLALAETPRPGLPNQR